MDRLRPKVAALIAALEPLVALLDRDAQNSWRIAAFLADAREMLARDFNALEANLLAGAVMQIYGGYGSFSDYYPPALADYINELERLRGDVYERALAIRVVDKSAVASPRRRFTFGLLTVMFAVTWLCLMLGISTPAVSTPYYGLTLFCGCTAMLASGLFLVRRSRQNPSAAAAPPTTSADASVQRGTG